MRKTRTNPLTPKLLLAIGVLTLSTIAPAAMASTPESCKEVFFIRTEVDFHRQWGVQLLRDDDPVFESAEYHEALRKYAKPGVVSFYPSGPYRTPYTQLFEDYKKLFERTDGAWSPGLLRFTNTGTEANNVLFELAEFAYQKRTGHQARRAHLLYFGEPYGGTFGRVAEIGSRYQTDPEIRERFHVPTPTSSSLHPTDPVEIARLKKIEDEAIVFIRDRIANDQLEIGGIFLEPISTVHGLHFYRPVFLQRLRTLADELDVPIMADEIFTGGGRTGEFWAFQHYGVDFRPDVFTFGKGLAVSGLGFYHRRREDGDIIEPRWRWPSWENTVASQTYSYPKHVLDNTSRVSPLTLVQSYFVLRRIIDGKLVSAARTVGAKALKRIRLKAQQRQIPMSDISGIGLLFSVGRHTDALTPTTWISEYEGRWSPPLTTPLDEFDDLLR